MKSRQLSPAFFSFEFVDFEILGRGARVRAGLFVLLAAGAAVAAPAVSQAQAPSFQGVGFPSGWQFTGANAVSLDGKVVVGYGTNASGRPEAFRWVGGLITPLGMLSTSPGRTF